MKAGCNEFCEGHLDCPNCGKETCGKVTAWKHYASSEGVSEIEDAQVLCLECKNVYNVRGGRNR